MNKANASELMRSYNAIDKKIKELEKEKEKVKKEIQGYTRTLKEKEFEAYSRKAKFYIREYKKLNEQKLITDYQITDFDNYVDVTEKEIFGIF